MSQEDRRTAGGNITAVSTPSAVAFLAVGVEQPPESAPLNANPIIFFDGVCGLCNRSVDFILARDRRRQFRFAPLQGETARLNLSFDEDDPLRSMVLLDATGVYRRSDAVWRVLVALGGVWCVMGWLLRIIPRLLRNWGYGVIAGNRYRWFGKHETCRMPRPDERELFLP